ncbi:MAG: YbjQ family protein [Bacillota bacterium]
MKIIRFIGAAAFMLGFFTAVFVGVPWYVHNDPTLPWWLKTAVFLLMGGILLVLATVAVEHPGAERRTTDFEPVGARTEVLILNSAEVPHHRISEILGLVRGHTIFAVSLGRDLSALMRLIPGGELVEYTEMMGQARDMAVQRMTVEAEELGADAIINVRFITTAVVTGAAELLAYGTAVRLDEPVT